MLETTMLMNSDIFDNVRRANYKVADFTKLVLEQAREIFEWNGYDTFVSDGVLSVKK